MKLNICPFKSLAEANTYITFVMLGMSIMMVVSAVTAAPSFITKYYSYATGVPDAECENPTFWNNVNTFYNLGTYVTQLCTEPLALAPVFRRIPLRLRMLVALAIPFLEMLLLILVPVFKVPTQQGAIAVVMVVAILGGFSKALCDTTANALVGPFPTKFVNGEQWGLSVASLAMCVLQCILKASMGESFNDVLWMSRLYFGIAILFQVATIVQFLLLYRNPFAHMYIAEFRMMQRQRSEGDGEYYATEPVSEIEEGRITMEGRGDEEVDEELDARLKTAPEDDDSSDNSNAAVLRGKGDADKMVDRDQSGNLTSGEQMMNASALSVTKRVWPMLLSCFFAYMTTMSLFPGVFFAVDVDSDWYFTIIILLFSLGDFLARIVLMIRPLRPSPMMCMIGSAGRLILILPLALCVHGTIHGAWMPYIVIFLLGFTMGYFGCMSMIHCPRSPTLHTAGERSLASIICGIFLQLGLAVGCNLAVLINLLI